MPATQYERGPALQDMGLITGGGGFTYADGITAFAGGARPNAVPLTATINRVSTVATAADSVALPAAVGGQICIVSNAGANAMQVFAAVGTSDVINTTAGSTGISVAAAKTVIFVSPAAARWMSVLTA